VPGRAWLRGVEAAAVRRWGEAHAVMCKLAAA
jgi:hypothetical protein